MSELTSLPIWDRALAIDVDRCLVRPDNCVQKLQVAYDEHRIDFKLPAVNLVNLQQDTESTMASFSPYGVVEELTADQLEVHNRIFDRFVDLSKADNDVVYEDTHPFIDYLLMRQIPFYLNSRGIEYEWQRYKVEAGRLGSLPMALTTATDKGTELYWTRELDDQGRVYYAPQNILQHAKHLPFAARHIDGVDDYRRSLRNWPADCRGYWLDRPESRQNLKQIEQASIELPPNVLRVESLYEIIDLLKKQ